MRNLKFIHLSLNINGHGLMTFANNEFEREALYQHYYYRNEFIGRGVDRFRSGWRAVGDVGVHCPGSRT